MALLFSYGSLKEERVQLATFGRLLRGHSDALLGFTLASVRIDDPQIAAKLGQTHHANVEVSADGRVAGMVFEIDDDELARVDDYEAEFAYERVTAALASGRRAWVYVHRDTK
jgi:gamma-glutamylcyclotransferase (GGCT)/AIG2-like uncharacterized protein YtfP